MSVRIEVLVEVPDEDSSTARRVGGELAAVAERALRREPAVVDLYHAATVLRTEQRVQR